MNGRTVTSPSTVSNIYWNTLKDLSATDKMQLVVLLTNSVLHPDTQPKAELTEEEKDRDFKSLCGCWADDPEDTARMEAAIKDGRKNEFMREINLDD